MKQYQNICLIFFIFGMFFWGTSCLSQKYTKKGMEYEQMGLKIEAAEYYYQALVRKTDNIEAKLGLKRTGQMVLDDYLQKIDESYTRENNALTVEEYQKARKYYQALSKLGVDLNLPPQYQQYYEEAKNAYLEELYLSAIQYLNNQEFETAETALRQIISLNANYRDSKEKLKTAICEPKYLNIIRLIEAKKYRTAYFDILDLENKADSYKDIVDLKRECLEKGAIFIIVSPITSKTGNSTVAESVRLSLMRKLQNLNDPFLHILEQETTALSSKTMILSCEVQSVNYIAGKLSKTEEKGWLKKVHVNQETGEKKIEYNKVNYYLYQQQRSLDLNINYKLTDQRLQRVVASNSKNFSATDALRYATFDGSYKDLVAGYWKNKSTSFNSKEDRIDDNWISNQALQRLLKAPRTIKEYHILLEEVKASSVQMIAKDIQEFLENEQ